MINMVRSWVGLDPILTDLTYDQQCSLMIGLQPEEWTDLIEGGSCITGIDGIIVRLEYSGSPDEKDVEAIFRQIKYVSGRPREIDRIILR